MLLHGLISTGGWKLCGCLFWGYWPLLVAIRVTGLGSCLARDSRWSWVFPFSRPTLAFPEPPTTLDEKTNEAEDTGDGECIEDGLNQHRECCLCNSVEPEMEPVRIWKHVFGGTHIWVSKDICKRHQIHFLISIFQRREALS